MIIKRIHLIFLLLNIIFIPSCNNESPTDSNRIIIGISADVESLNPLYSFNVVEGNITELLYLSLVEHRWNDDGNISTLPMLAERWEWNEDSTSITIRLREDVYWTDSMLVTADDVVFSFDAYSDPDIQSRMYGTFTDFYAENDMSIDLNKTFTVQSPFIFTIHFNKTAVPDLFSIDLPIIPKHIYENVDRKNFAASEKVLPVVTNGAFQFDRWDKNQSIILKSNPASFLYSSSSVDEIIFKVVPDYNSRLTQLKNGEIDMMEDIKPDDIDELKKIENLTIAPLHGREYEYVGWSNIDLKAFEEDKIVPHKFFGNARVRKALTYAINRDEILNEYLNGFGEVASGPVSPIFKDAVDNSLKPYEYNPAMAKAILAEEGWRDTDNDGVLEKGNEEFAFTLYIAGGNPRRSFAATLIKNNLKAVGIDVSISTLELGVFIENLYTKKMDAWIASWFVPIPVDLKTYWFSDLQSTPLNLVNYQNRKADEILLRLEGKIHPEEKNKLYKEFQKIMHEDQPVSFMYWIDNITAYNNRIKNVNVNPLGFIHHCWEWETAE